MPIVQRCYTIRQADKLTGDVHSFWIDCPDLAGSAAPGQFVHIRVPGFLLRRPISICEIDSGAIRLVFQVRGPGTEVMADLAAGDDIDLLGPLGTGFPRLDPAKKATFVGGGIGVPPLLEAAKHYEAPAVFLGFRDSASVILREDFRQAGAKLTLTTDDGSFGLAGLVTMPLEKHLAAERPDVLYACGPTGLLRGVQALCETYGIPAYLSLEERMACGVGACLGCAVPIRTPSGGQTYKHVCKDGPVFAAKEVVLHG